MLMYRTKRISLLTRYDIICTRTYYDVTYDDFFLKRLQNEIETVPRLIFDAALNWIRSCIM